MEGEKRNKEGLEALFRERVALDEITTIKKNNCQ